MGAVVEGFADEEDSGAGGGGAQGAGGSEGEGGERGGLVRTLGALDQGDGQGGRGALAEEAAGQGLDGAGPHVDGEGAAALDQGLPLGFGLGEVMTLQERDPPGDAAVREGDARCCGRRLHGTDAGNDLEGDAGGAEGEGFFPAPAEDEGVTALETHDLPTLLGVDHQQAVDLLLGGPALAAALPNREGQGLGGKQVLEGWVQQGVVENDIRCLESPEPPEGQQIRVARTGAHQADEAQGRQGGLRRRRGHRFQRRGGG